MKSTQNFDENNMNDNLNDRSSEIFSENEIISDPIYNELSVESMNKNEPSYEYIIEDQNDNYRTSNSLESISNKNNVNNFKEKNQQIEENIYNHQNIEENSSDKINKSSDNNQDKENYYKNSFNYDRDISVSYYSRTFDISFNTPNLENKEENNPVNDQKSRIANLRREVLDSETQQLSNHIQKITSIREKIENEVHKNIERAEQNILDRLSKRSKRKRETVN